MVKSQILTKYILQIIPLIVATIMLSACSTPQKSNSHASWKNTRYVPYNSQNTFETRFIKSKILKQYTGWKAVRYRFGGSSKKGIDCSAFVQLTFREQFGINLPRSTSAQQTVGKKIQRIKLKAGDLVLFRAGPTGRHIGIYLDNNKFVHVSATTGVTISSLNDQYWKKRYHTGRRVLHNSNRD
ncbi:bifunctional murein DD-endopeptidase/murein LD-carboxypeptidase [Candidatus Regiella insecticola]|nr:bifunctional murein DD-endopeptidase/murein LD-carboxypeptidase [Candidatus Regiella insecticola]